MAGAYRATNAKILKNKTRIMLIDIHIKSQMFKAHIDEKFKVDRIVINICRHICN